MLCCTHGHCPSHVDTYLHRVEEKCGGGAYSLSPGNDRPRNGGGGKTVQSGISSGEDQDYDFQEESEYRTEWSELCGGEHGSKINEL